jgi:ubiquinone/menaquinone biosynthesis C-methylase UbiE
VNVNLGFSGEVVELYHRYRHGYPAAVVDVLTDAFQLTSRDVVVDLGCGTGQLTLPVAAKVRAVIGVDTEPDMLIRARQAAEEADISNVTWVLGADTDLPALGNLLADTSIGAVTIGQALHWMDYEELFRSAVPLVRAGGGVAVVTNGAPLWLHDTDWSRALRACLEQWWGATLTSACGTDEQSQQRYQEALSHAGYDVLSTSIEYVLELSLDEIVGGVLSAMPVDRLPAPDARPAFFAQVHEALGPHERFREQVRVAILAGRVP